MPKLKVKGKTKKFAYNETGLAAYQKAKMVKISKTKKNKRRRK
jgi:hypothetical protein